VKTAQRNQTAYEFDPNADPLFEVVVGEAFHVEMEDSQNGRIRSESDVLTAATDLEHVNPCTGPVAVRGAEPGDVVAVEILSIDLISPGFSCVLPGDGVLRHKTTELTRLWDIQNGIATLRSDPRFSFPTTPLIGTLGTTPVSAVATGHAGLHGGNLDNPMLGVGSRLYAPVYVPGALLMFGDCHASQADGEVMMPIEAKADTVVRVVKLIKQAELGVPLVETIDRWATNCVGETVEEAITQAVESLATLLVKKLGVDLNTAELLIAAWGEARLNQIAGMGIYPAVARAEIPKGIIGEGLLREYP